MISQLDDAGLAAALLSSDHAKADPAQPRLARLNVANCAELTCDSMRPLALAGAFAWLTHLDASNCAQLGDAALAALAMGAPRLAVLDVSHCRLVTDAGVCCIARELFLVQVPSRPAAMPPPL